MKFLKRLRSILKWLLIALIIWCAGIGATIVRRAAMDETRKADVAIVMGAAAYGDKPSPVFEQRIAHGVTLYKNGTVKKIILTGGYGTGAEMSESEVARRYALDQGVPERDLLLEKTSRTTLENLRQACDIMKKQGLNEALLVSDPMHMERAARMMHDLGVKAYCSPTPTSRYESALAKAGFLFREIYAITAYLIAGV
jgi:uncharacterized SAM-binding protein YcdF (DUF218 family)